MPSRKPATKKRAAPKASLKIAHMALAKSRQKGPRHSRAAVDPFKIPDALHPPGVTRSAPKLAQDEIISSSAVWAASAYGYAIQDGMAFLGYPELSMMATRPEYRRMAEMISRHMTRKWIKIKSKGDEDKSEKIAKIESAMERLAVKDAFCKVSEQDCFFGRGHLYIDLGTTDDRTELLTPIGDGNDLVSKAKIKKGSLRRISPVEAIWSYPTKYESNNPLKPDWYRPTSWMVMGTQLHASRFLTFIGREVPDLLKPTYSFGGLSLSQMAKPYVDNWLETRQSVADIIQAFSVFVLKTKLMDQLSGDGDALFSRAELFNNLRDNRGLMMLDKDAEDFENVSAPLSTLDSLQAQTQEHMCAVSGIPTVVLLGIQPAGLNASSEGEMNAFYEWIHSCQEQQFRPNLTRVIGIIQLSEFGEVDPDIVFDFEPLEALDTKEIAEEQNIKANTDATLVDAGIIDRSEARTRLASDKDSQYQGLEPDELPKMPSPAEALKTSDRNEDDDSEQVAEPRIKAA